MLEGQAATEQEGDEIVAPEVADFPPLLDELAPTVDAVTRQVGTEVSATLSEVSYASCAKPKPKPQLSFSAAVG